MNGLHEIHIGLGELLSSSKFSVLCEHVEVNIISNMGTLVSENSLSF